MGKREPKKLQLWHPSPWDGVPGKRAALLRFMYNVIGPAQLGSSNDKVYLPPNDPECPDCKQPLNDHVIKRGGPGKPTHMICPRPEAKPKIETTEN